MKIYVKTFTGYGGTYPFDVEPSITIEQLKTRLREKTDAASDNDYFRSTLLRYNGDDLCNEMETLLYYDVKEDAMLEFHDLNVRGRSMGHLGIKFVDVTDDKSLTQSEWAKTAPRWRIAGRGLCLEGNCKNVECKAFKQQVIMPIGYKRFDLVNDSDETTTVCPMCRQYVEPITCGFNNCWWRYEGKKVEENGSGKPPKKCSSDWKRVDDVYHYFDTKNGSTVEWRQLVIETVKEKQQT